MKYFIYLLIVPLLLIPAYDVSAKEVEPKLIEEYSADLTGDGKQETIRLYGVLFSPDAAFLKDIYAMITSDTKEWRIDYQGGYDPVIQFIDLNHDGIDDLFYQSATGGSGGLYSSQLDTIAEGNLKNIPLPNQDYVKGHFEDGFKAVIDIIPNTKPIVMNVESRKEDYIRLGIYDEQGNIIEQTALMVDPIAFFEPVLISESKGYGLKSYKQISGAYHADRLGVLETLWYFENGKWIILHTEWKEAG